MLKPLSKNSKIFRIIVQKGLCYSKLLDKRIYLEIYELDLKVKEVRNCD